MKFENPIINSKLIPSLESNQVAYYVNYLKEVSRFGPGDETNIYNFEEFLQNLYAMYFNNRNFNLPLYASNQRIPTLIKRLFSILSKGVTEEDNGYAFNASSVQKDEEFQGILGELNEKQNSEPTGYQHKSLHNKMTCGIEISPQEQLTIDDINTILFYCLDLPFAEEFGGPVLICVTSPVDTLHIHIKQIDVNKIQQERKLSQGTILYCPVNLGFGHWIVKQFTISDQLPCCEDIHPFNFPGQKDLWSCGYWTVAIIIYNIVEKARIEVFPETKRDSVNGIYNCVKRRKQNEGLAEQEAYLLRNQLFNLIIKHLRIPSSKEPNFLRNSGADKLQISKIQKSEAAITPYGCSDTRLRVGLFNDKDERIMQVQQDFCSVLKDTGFGIGQAYSDGDCFFDSCAQALNEAKRGQYVFDGLRLLCSDYAKKLDNEYPVPRKYDDPETPKENWIYWSIYQKLLSDKGLRGEKINNEHVKNETKKNAIERYNQYLMYVSCDGNTIRQLEKQGLGSGIAEWGEQEIDGRIICQVLKIKIHVVEVHEELFNDPNIGSRILHQIIDSNGVHSIEKTTQDLYDDPNIIHIANYRNHFIPILRGLPLEKINDNQPVLATTSFFHHTQSGSPISLDDDKVSSGSDHTPQSQLMGPLFFEPSMSDATSTPSLTPDQLNYYVNLLMEFILFKDKELKNIDDVKAFIQNLYAICGKRKFDRQITKLLDIASKHVIERGDFYFFDAHRVGLDEDFQRFLNELDLGQIDDSRLTYHIKDHADPVDHLGTTSLSDDEDPQLQLALELSTQEAKARADEEQRHIQKYYVELSVPKKVNTEPEVQFSEEDTDEEDTYNESGKVFTEPYDEEAAMERAIKESNEAEAKSKEDIAKEFEEKTSEGKTFSP